MAHEAHVVEQRLNDAAEDTDRTTTAIAESENFDKEKDKIRRYDEIRNSITRRRDGVLGIITTLHEAVEA